MYPSFIGTGIGSLKPRLQSPSFTPLPSNPTHHLRTRRCTLTMSQKMLHAVYRVGDLDATGRFLQSLGMHCLRERDSPSEKFSNAFYGFGPEQKGEHFSLELTYNYGVDSYDIGTGFGHFGVAVEDVAATVDRVRADGFKVTREPGPVKGTVSLFFPFALSSFWFWCVVWYLIMRTAKLLTGYICVCVH